MCLCSQIRSLTLKKKIKERLEYDESLKKSVKRHQSADASSHQLLGMWTNKDSRFQNSSTYTAKSLGPERSSTNIRLPKKRDKKNPSLLCSPHMERGLGHLLSKCRECTKEKKKESS